jgi:hypothetical protein
MCGSTVSRSPVGVQRVVLLTRCVLEHDRFQQAESTHCCRNGRIIRIRLNWIHTDAHFFVYAQKEYYSV